MEHAHPLLDPGRMGTPVEPGEFDHPLPGLHRLDQMPEKFGISALDLLVRHHESWFGPMDPVERKTLARAIQDCHAYHGQNLRKDGKTRYEVHPFHVALYGARSAIPLYGIIAYLLHDAVEDERISLYDIEHKYGKMGPKVARVVRYMSNPKVYAPDKNRYADSGFPLNKDPHRADGMNDAIYVLPGDTLYDRKQDPKDKALEGKFYDEITEIKKRRLYDLDKGKNQEAQIIAVLGKQFDGKHNEKTLDGVSDPQKREQQRKKIREVSGWAAETFHPALAIGRSSDAKRRGADPKKWFAELAPLTQLDLRHLEKMPRTDENVINIHPDEDEPDTYNVFFPYSHYGSTPEDHRRIRGELERQASGLKTNTGGLDVRTRKTLMPQGLTRFHAFRLHFHANLEPEDEGATFKKALLQVLKHVQGRLCDESKVPYFADYSAGELHALKMPQLEPGRTHAGRHAFFIPRSEPGLAAKVMAAASGLGFRKIAEKQARPDSGRTQSPHRVIEMDVPAEWKLKRTIRRHIGQLARMIGLA